MAFFCGACRYRVTAYPDWTVEKVGGWLAGWEGAVLAGEGACCARPGCLRQTQG
jgi:hypothetical protein